MRAVLIAIVLACSGLFSVAVAQQEGQRRQVDVGQRVADGGVTRTNMQGQMMRCAVKVIFAIREVQEFRCDEYRLGGKCTAGNYLPNYPTKDCPRMCVRSRWVTVGNMQKKVGETLENCVPIYVPQPGTIAREKRPRG